jgi:hypothetical protein
MYFLLMGIVAVPQLWDYFFSQQGERRVNIEGLASSFFGTERSSWEFENPARCRNVKQGNKNILRFGERKIGLII